MLNFTSTTLLASAVLVLALVVLWTRPGRSRDYDDGERSNPTSLFVMIALVAAGVVWSTCGGPGSRGGGGSDSKVHRVNPPGVFALAVILPVLMMTAIGVVTYGVLGFFVGIALGAIIAFITLLRISSSPEYSQALLTDA